jgi:hypothetical protein
LDDIEEDEDDKKLKQDNNDGVTKNSKAAKAKLFKEVPFDA